MPSNSKSFTMILIVWCTNGAPINPSSPLATFSGHDGWTQWSSSPNSSPVVPKTTVTRQGREKWSAMSADSPWTFAVQLSSIFTPWKTTSWRNWTRDLEQKRIKVIPCVKHYGLVFDKRVINTNTKSSYPYGYERIREEVDLLLDL